VRGILLSTLTAVYLFGAAEPSANILGEVAKLRQKYEECRAGQSAVLGIDPKLYGQCEKERNESNSQLKGYKSRIANLEGQIGQNTKELAQIKKRNTEIERELFQKKGVIQSLEQTMNIRDKKYREEVARNEILSVQTNTAKVSRIERQSLTNALTKAKFEVERLEKIISKTTKERIRLEKELSDARAQADKLRNSRLAPAPKVQEAKPIVVSSDQNGKIKALQDELSKANTLILKLQNNANSAKPQTIVEKVVYKDRPVEKVIEKVVYKDRPVVQEKIVTKVVEPTKKIVALQRELTAAQNTIVNLKNNANTAKSQTIIEKVVYKDRPVEKVIEKVVYKDRPLVQEKIVTKIVEPTEKIVALQRELSAAKTTIANLKSSAPKAIIKEKIVEKIVYKDRPVVQEKIVYKDRPVEKVVEKVVYKEHAAVQDKIVTKAIDPTEKLNKALQEKLAQSEAQTAKLKSKTKKLVPPKAAKLTLQPVVVSAAPVVKKGTSSAYRMASNAPIYNAPGGHQVDTWEERRSFTAGNPSNGWVHITGYFVNRVWQSTVEGENLWVKESDVIRR
jgi:hypothetical protein